MPGEKSVFLKPETTCLEPKSKLFNTEGSEKSQIVNELEKQQKVAWELVEKLFELHDRLAPIMTRTQPSPLLGTIIGAGKEGCESELTLCLRVRTEKIVEASQMVDSILERLELP